ncbi:hypothetical protein MLD38_038065 [Melastoma candidum]|uniref:Uncharacterized protein n=1 Tax=Melastoma candidum TaxID=119954 RepID=A0ACB9KY15_9MYRT|nr:hypothetical protein MLD38_038065 [Melastoma candidum]
MPTPFLEFMMFTSVATNFLLGSTKHEEVVQHIEGVSPYHMAYLKASFICRWKGVTYEPKSHLNQNFVRFTATARGWSTLQ